MLINEERETIKDVSVGKIVIIHIGKSLFKVRFSPLDLR